jgi:DTW domain-containing protein YfiP
LLQQLPRLSLHNPPASRYLIRKAHGPGQLSTLEATCHALMQLEQDESKYQSLLTAFNGFVAQQAVYRQY